MSVGTLQQNQNNQPEKVKYKSPQELFSTFKFPDIEASTRSKSSHKTSSLNIAKIETEKKIKLKLIKPNIIDPPSLDQPTTTTMQPSKLISSPVPSSTPPSKPLLLQGPSNIPPFYYMNQGSGYIGYSAPFTQGSFPPVYGMAPPYMDPRYLYASQGNVIKRDQTPSPTLAKEIKIMDSSQISTALKQSFATIQGQMAANQIPLCLVQDSQGQLHQLVYTVPEHLYEKYMSAAKKGLKVRVQPQMNSLKIALSNNETGNDNENRDKTCPSNISEEDLKLVKDIHKIREKTNEIKTTSISKEKVDNSKNRNERCVIPILPQTTTDLKTPAKLPTGAKDISDNTEKAKDLQQCANDSIDVTKSLFAQSPSTEDTKTSITKDFLSIISRNRMNKFAKSSVNGLVKQDTTLRADVKTNSSIKSPVTVDLTPSTYTAGDNYVKQPSKNCINHAQPIQRDILSKKQVSAREIDQHDNLSKDYEIFSNNNKSTTNTYPDTLGTNNDMQMIKAPIIDDFNPIDNSNELQTNINTIDNILAKNKSDLIPKSDVEALLKCLKRKLEETDIVDSLNKKHKLEEESREQAKPNKAQKYFQIKSNSYDYESSDLLSPETFSEEGSPCNSVFYSAGETASVSSPESTLSQYEKMIPGVSTQSEHIENSESITEVLFGNPDSGQVLSPDIFQYDFSNKKLGTNEPVNKIQNSNHAVLDLFDNLKDVDIFDNENFLYPEIMTAPPDKTIASTNLSLANSKKPNNNSKNDQQSYETEHFSFPTGQQNIDMDLFDHLWGELDNL